MIEPIKPQHMTKAKLESLPDAVMEAFNELIAKHWNGRNSRFKQEEVVELIVQKKGCSRSDIFENGWLDVEHIFRKANWRVQYDKPGFNESYSATFTFTSALRST